MTGEQTPARDVRTLMTGIAIGESPRWHLFPPCRSRCTRTDDLTAKLDSEHLSYRAHACSHTEHACASLALLYEGLAK